MNAEQNYGVPSTSTTPNEPSARTTDQTAQPAFGTWPVYPALHRPASIRPELTASTLATYSAVHLANIGVRYAAICEAVAADETGPIHVVEPLTRSLIWAADFREGKAQPSLSLITWLATVHPRVNLNYLFRGEGEPLLPVASVHYSVNRLVGDALNVAITQLTDRLHRQVYPALTDPANTIYVPGEEGEEDEILTLSEQALAINLHREFVEACGECQQDWIVAYWQELGWLFEQLFGNTKQRDLLLTDRTYLELIHSFAA